MPGKGPVALAKILLLVGLSIAALLLIGPPPGVWIGVLLIVFAFVAPEALATDSDDLFDDGFESGMVLTWPFVVVGAGVLAASILVWLI